MGARSYVLLVAGLAASVLAFGARDLRAQTSSTPPAAGGTSPLTLTPAAVKDAENDGATAAARQPEASAPPGALEPPATPVTAPVPQATPTEPPPSEPPAPAGGSTTSKALNPDISVIGNFVGLAGHSPADEQPSLDLREAEVSFQSIVDPYARADVFLTFSNGDVGVEEGYITFLALPGGLLVKVGKMRDAFGKVDGMHAHVLPTADRPLVNRSLLGGEDGLADSGVSVSRLVPFPGVFVEVTGQVFRGQSQVFKAAKRGDLAYVGHLRVYRDLGESSNIDLGGSLADGHNGDGADSTTRLIGADATFRYKPLRRAIYRHLLARGELVWSRREAADAPAQKAFGAYAYLEYQFARRWLAGVRYDVSDHADKASLRDRGTSVVLSYAPSEFSLVRAQYRHTRFGAGATADELLAQVQFAIGAHGAHPF